MEKIKVAIIDDGVYPEPTDSIFLAKSLRITENCDIIKDETKQYLSHGTICAKIIALTSYEKTRLFSIKIMNDRGEGQLKQLICALEWCYLHNIKLINLSLGTSRYDDSLKLGPIIQKMIAKNIIMVAAFANNNKPSWPAYYKNVIGVRADRFQESTDSKIYVDKNFPGNIENAFVINQKKTGLIERVTDYIVIGPNSFAAPVVTGFLAKYINQKSTFEESLSLLLNESEIFKFSSLFNIYTMYILEPEIPVIWVDSAILDELVCLFEKNQFNAAAFTDFGMYIPLEIYLSEKSVSTELYSFLYKTYNPDIMIFSRKNPDQKYCCDAMISKDLKVFADGKINKFHSVKELYEFLLRIFDA